MFSIENPDFAAQLNDEKWYAKVAYLADIFSHLNYLNESMQGKEENVLTSSHKLNGFLRKLRIWKLQVEKKNLQVFPLTCKIDSHGHMTSELISNHFLVLEDKMDNIFPPSLSPNMTGCAILMLCPQNPPPTSFWRKNNNSQNFNQTHT
jgi:hypothetical protein